MRRIFACLLVLTTLVACASKEERRDEFYRNGLKLEEAGRYAEARVEARNIIKLDPEHAGAYLLLARCALRDQNWREAYGGFQRALELESDSVEAMLGLGRIYLLSGETAKAEEMSNQVLRLEPASMDGRMLRAGAMLRARRHDEALLQLQEILTREPAHEDALMALSIIHAEQGRADQAMEVIRQGLEANPDSRTLHFRAASLAGDAGRFAEAEGHLLKLKSLDPDNRGVMVLLAALYERMGDMSRVEIILRDLLAAEPESEEARLRLVEFLVRDEKPAAALEVVDEAPGGPTPKLRLAAADVRAAAGDIAGAEAGLAALADDADAGTAALDARLLLSELLLKRGDRDGALAQLDELLQRNPGDARGHAARGRLLMLLGRHEEALGELRIAVHDAPEDTGAAILLARAHQALGNSLSAVEVLRIALDRTPEAERLRLELARHHERAGNPDAALGVLQAGAAHGGMTPRMLFAMGDIEARRKKYVAAENYFIEAAENPAVEVPARLRVAALYAQRGDWDKARTIYRTLLSDHPDARGAAAALVALEDKAGRPDEALAWARQWSDSRPDDPLAADLLGRAAQHFKEYVLAEEAFRESMRRAPEWSVPMARLASLFVTTGRRDAAIAESRAVLDRNPDSVPAALLLGQLLQAGGQIVEAEGVYRDLLQRKPDLRAAANNLAYCIVSDSTASPERLQEALTLARKASTEGDPAALDTLGWTYYRLGDNASALTHLRRAHASLSREPSVAYHLARVLADDGQFEEARTLLQDVLNSGAEFPELALARELLENI